MESSELPDIDSLGDWVNSFDFDSMLDDVNFHIPFDDALEEITPYHKPRDSGSVKQLPEEILPHSHQQLSTLAIPVAVNPPSLSSPWLADGPTNLRSSVHPDNSMSNPSLATHTLPVTDTVDTLISPSDASQGKDGLDSQWQTPPKIGKRFSSRTSKILKTWLADHIQQPYPTVRDVEHLQKQTGLTRQQITIWFRNARRQRKAQAARPPTPSLRPIDLNKNTQLHEQLVSFHDMNPLQRWQNSPPEHDPASCLAIAQTVSGLHGPTDIPTPTGDVGSSGLWRDDSSASSAGTSQFSNSSMGSAWSDDSQLSNVPLSRRRKLNKRRRRRAYAPQPELEGCSSLNPVCYPFQCTFCTETFKTKHNWQRHEKSLHLSLERWECSPQGPTFLSSAGALTCTYCGHSNPDHDHLLKHNYTACHERCAEERIFYRKDHLQQHLKLVHQVQFMKDPMEQWRREIQNLRSRCGFCDARMDSWHERIEHLADHFKQGRSMADWKGSWGFEDNTLEMVENSMPPYLIHYERNSPWPFTTQQGPVETPVNAFELIKLELEYWMSHTNAGKSTPSTSELQYESCCIILGSELLSNQSEVPEQSWLRDLFMSSQDLVKRALLRPAKASLKTRITQLKIHGKQSIFEQCSAEARLVEFVGLSRATGSPCNDADLQLEASRIISSMEAASSKPSVTFVHFLKELVFASTNWLSAFRARTGLDLDWTYNVPDLAEASQPPEPTLQSNEAPQTPSGNEHTCFNTQNVPIGTTVTVESSAPVFQDDGNCYRRLTRELSRYVSSVLSPRNPAKHVPSDEELQNQARWIMFEDDDPWNQTPADNPNWLQDFKRTIGLVGTNL